MTKRMESDSMGALSISAGAYWGAQTQRAVENFNVSPFRIPLQMINALALIKGSMAAAHKRYAVIAPELCDAIVTAAAEMRAGKWNSHFPIDVFQTGSGTSWNMNSNEVIANRANELLGSEIGQRAPVHPNDHVNRGQSSNDVIPTAIQIANRVALHAAQPRLQRLADTLQQKAVEFRDVLKLGRTHLQDAVPMTVGDEFSGYAAQMRAALARLDAMSAELEHLPLGGTAVGTGINGERRVTAAAIATIAAETKLPFTPAPNRFALMAGRDAQVGVMAALNGVAVVLMKLGNDLRLLASGPRSGLGEIMLPALQPGSSIMPGKINPVMPEMIIQVAAFLMGKHHAVSIAATHGPLELNMMHPLIAYETLTALELAGNSAEALAARCIAGITVDAERCREHLEQSLALVTPLAIRIGYDTAAELAHRAYRERRTIREVAAEAGVLPADELERILDPQNMRGEE